MQTNEPLMGKRARKIQCEEGDLNATVRRRKRK
jgi:hypothetical protein